MNNHPDPFPMPDPLAEILQRVLEFHHVIADATARFGESDASERSAPRRTVLDADSIPDVVHHRLRDAVDRLEAMRSPTDLWVASDVLEEMLDAISDELFHVDPFSLDRDGRGRRDFLDGEGGGWPGR